MPDYPSGRGRCPGVQSRELEEAHTYGTPTWMPPPISKRLYCPTKRRRSSWSMMAYKNNRKTTC